MKRLTYSAAMVAAIIILLAVGMTAWAMDGGYRGNWAVDPIGSFAIPKGTPVIQSVQPTSTPVPTKIEVEVDKSGRKMTITPHYTPPTVTPALPVQPAQTSPIKGNVQVFTCTEGNLYRVYPQGQNRESIYVPPEGTPKEIRIIKAAGISGHETIVETQPTQVMETTTVVTKTTHSPESKPDPALYLIVVLGFAVIFSFFCLAWALAHR